MDANASTDAAQAEIADEFAFFGDWTERYQYLIDLGRKLPAFPEAWKSEEHRLHGCQSMVWIVPQGDAGKLDFHAASDSAIVSGLVALVLRAHWPQRRRDPRHRTALHRGDRPVRHLSPTRSNGLASMLATIREHARAALAGEPPPPPATPEAVARPARPRAWSQSAIHRGDGGVTRPSRHRHARFKHACQHAASERRPPCRSRSSAKPGHRKSTALP